MAAVVGARWVRQVRIHFTPCHLKLTTLNMGLMADFDDLGVPLGDRPYGLGGCSCPSVTVDDFSRLGYSPSTAGCNDNHGE